MSRGLMCLGVCSLPVSEHVLRVFLRFGPLLTVIQ